MEHDGGSNAEGGRPMRTTRGQMPAKYEDYVVGPYGGQNPSSQQGTSAPPPGASPGNPSDSDKLGPKPVPALITTRSSISSSSTLVPQGSRAQSVRSSAISSKSMRSALSAASERVRISCEANKAINILLEKLEMMEAQSKAEAKLLGQLEADLKQFSSVPDAELSEREKLMKMRLEVTFRERSDANERVQCERDSKARDIRTEIQSIRQRANSEIAQLTGMPALVEEEDEEKEILADASENPASTAAWVVKLPDPQAKALSTEQSQGQPLPQNPDEVSDEEWAKILQSDVILQALNESYVSIQNEITVWRSQYGIVSKEEHQRVQETLRTAHSSILQARIDRSIEVWNGISPMMSKVRNPYVPKLLAALGYGSLLEPKDTTPEQKVGILSKFGFQVRPKEHEMSKSSGQFANTATAAASASFASFGHTHHESSQIHKPQVKSEPEPVANSTAAVTQTALKATTETPASAPNVENKAKSGREISSSLVTQRVDNLAGIHLPTPPGSIKQHAHPVPHLQHQHVTAQVSTWPQQQAIVPQYQSVPQQQQTHQQSAWQFRPPPAAVSRQPPPCIQAPPLPIVYPPPQPIYQPPAPPFSGHYAQPPQVEAAINPNQQGPTNSDISNQLLLQLSKFVMAEKEEKQSSKDPLSQFAIRQSLGNHLPKFDGSPDKWLSFTRMYDETTKSCGYSNTENLIRLQSCLQGKALEVVQCLLSSPDNLQAILETLQTHFGRPELIVSALIGKVVACNPVSADRIETMVEFGITVRNLVAAIKSLQQLDHLKNPILLGQLERKLTAAQKIQWGTWLDTTGKPLNLDSFHEWIDKQVKICQRFCQAETPKEKPFKQNSPKENKKQGNGSSFYVNENLKGPEKKETPSKASQKKPRDRLCAYCDKHGHKISACGEFAKLAVDERWKLVKDKSLCLGCLNSGHAVRVCRSKVACKFENCTMPHHHLLHADKSTAKSSSTTMATVEDSSSSPAPAETSLLKNYMATGPSKINLMVLPVRLKGKRGAVVNCFAFLDSGSTGTFIRSDLLDKLQLRGKKATVTVKTMHPDPVIEPCEIVNLRISPEKGPEEFHLTGVRAVDTWQFPYQSVTRDTMSQWTHLQGLDELTLYENAQPSILVGLDHGYLQTAMQLREGPQGSPIATLTKLGWVLSGKVNGEAESYSFYLSEVQQLAELHRTVKEQYSLEAIGVKVQDLKLRSLEDKRAQRILDETTRRVGGQWETGLLWRHDKICYPESYSHALKRLATQERKMDKDPLFAQALQDKMAEYKQKGYIVKLQPQEVIPDDKAYYLPYFGVTNPNKPKKFRLVFDAASRTHGVSFNDMILPGPDKLTPLLSVLMKFRQRPIAVTADIADMFHRVLIRNEDLPAQRFLYRGMERSSRPDVYQMKVMIFGSACSPCAAQEVKNRNALEFQDQCPEAVKAIIDRHYVDDYLDSFSSEEDARKVIGQVVSIHAKGGFVIRNWTSNQEAILDAIPEELKAPQHQSQDMEIDKAALTERVLGLHWKPQDDKFTFMPKFHKVPQEVLEGTRMPTKREALSLVMSVYDPLGFLSNFMVTAKIILQQAWKYQIGWDDELPESAAKDWKNWIGQLQHINQFQIPRCYSKSFTSGDIQLHIFCDASEEAYCAVAYFRIEDEDDISTALVMAKTRVTPLKYVSMPRLELQAALIGCRLMKLIMSCHDRPIPKVHFWTDSKTVIQWLRSESRRFTPFVAHRIGEIQEDSDVSDWHWISTKENVADEGTRSGKKTDLSSSSRWITGPLFLQDAQDQWPKDNTQVSEDTRKSMEAEMKSEFVAMCLSDCFMDVDRFSNFSRLVRSTAFVLRFIHNCRHKEKKGGEFTASDLEASQLAMYKLVQQEAFGKDITLIKEGIQLPKKSLLKKLSAFIDKDGLVRVEGRIQMAPGIPYETANPIILPPRHPFTRLLVMHQHVQCKHIGVEQVANELRKKFYIPAIRGLVRQTWARCQLCRNRRAFPKPPKMGQLPKERLERVSRPFTNCGVDYFGPYEVTIGRRHEKRYGCLFTCLATRAIHLEVASSLSTDSFIMCLIRFMALRGDPKVMYSDNGTNFVGANNELQAAIRQMDQDRLIKFYSGRGITWKFIPPRTPHQGGAWERMVRAVKEGLKHCLREKYPREETLRTVFREVQRLVNGHPLTYVAMDPDGEQALTPNHFLWGSSDGSQPMGDFDEKDMLRSKQWRIAMKMAEHFWERWTREYLPTLVRRQKWTDTTNPIKVGDVGVMADELKPREDWPIGRVLEVRPGNDGVVRSVAFKTKTGIYNRPVHKIGIFSLGDDFGSHSPKSGGTVAEDEEPLTSE